MEGASDSVVIGNTESIHRKKKSSLQRESNWTDTAEGAEDTASNKEDVIFSWFNKAPKRGGKERGEG